MNNKSIILAVVIGLVTLAADAVAFEIKPRGRVHIDYAIHDEDRRELGDGFRVRRARLGLAGSIDDNWAYKIEYDFAGNSTDAKDIYLRYTGLRSGTITIGHAKVPFGLESLTSSNSITLIERSLPTAFAPSRRLGVAYAAGADRWTASAMAFGQGVGAGTRSSDADEGLGLGGRVTFNPVRADRRLVHLGLAVSREEPEDRQLRQARFRTRPESRPSKVRLVDTGTIGKVDDITRLGLEAAWRSGPYSLQGEWMRTGVNRTGGSPDVDFDGYYLSGSWVLTGESRGYKGGAFGAVAPAGPHGAWEVTARYSTIDLDDGPVAGGSEQNWTVGVNWYANSRVRFMANYIRVRSERQGVSDDPGIFLMRGQVSF